MVSHLSPPRRHYAYCTCDVALKGLPGDMWGLVKEMWAVKVIQFGSSLLLITMTLGFNLRMPIT